MKKTGSKKSILLTVLSVVLLFAIAIGGILIVNESKLDKIQQGALEQLEQYDGDYDTNKIVLNNTSYSKAKELAAQFDAKLRITSDGKYATLTLPDGVTVRDVYQRRENRKYLSDLSLDMYSKISEEEGTAERLPSAPDYVVTDSDYYKQSYIDYLNIGNAWNSYRGNGITVAVIDTGIDTDHPEFTGRISEYSYNATEDKIVKDYTLADGGYDWSLIEDEQGHGTAVSGTVAAQMNGNGIVGVSPEVNLLVIKAECDENGSFYNTSDLVFGVYYAIERDVDVINMSFGGYSPVNPYASATKLAVESDVICVAAAGNDGTTQLCYPAADENVIGVGALAENSWELAGYSNYGENTDVVAPGTVYTTKKGGEYGSMNGTSFASPITAAALALYKQQNQYSEFSTVTEILYASCYDLGSLGKDWYFGYGALDVNALICEERGTVTFNMLTDELENTEQVFIRNHTLQNLPEPERTYAIFDGWYYDIHCTEELNWYSDVFTGNLTLYAKWVNEEDGVPYTYVTLPDNTVEIRSYTGRRRFITIPDMIDGKPVTSIGDFAFDGQNRLREVNLPKGLTNIGRYAFRNCNNLTKISLPEGVKSIGEYAFYNNVRLDGIAFEGNSKLQSVGAFAFAYSGLSRFELPAQVSSINGSAFYGATGLKSFTVTAANTYFKAVDGVLFNRTGSTLIAYPAGLKGDYAVPVSTRKIGDYAFGYTKSAVDLGGVQVIGNSSFSFSALNEIVIPDSVTSMGMSAFENSFNLKSVTLGSGLNSLPGSAFSVCYSLGSIEIPANIHTIGNRAFAGDTSLTSVTFADGSNLMQIGREAFIYTALQEIALPASLMTIGESAFEKVFSLSNVTFGENSSLQVIGNKAFAETISLSNIALPANLMQIGGYAFLDSGLTEITIPASVNYLGAGAFASCHSLTSITVEEGNEAYKDIDGVIYDRTMSEVIAYPAGNTATQYAVENTVTAIGEAAFYGSWNLDSVLLPQTLETVKKYAFYDCESVTNYQLPESLTYIEEYAFSNNVSLSGIAIPDNVYQISRFAFANDYKLRTITFNETSKLPRISYGAFAYTGVQSLRVPASVSTIAQGAFEGCNNLTSVTFAANSKLESVSAYMFDGCSNLSMVTFENGSALTSIQAHGFENMTKLQTVDFGNAKLTNIDNYAFRFCESLQTLPIPEGVTYIGRFAFYGAKNLIRFDLPESIDYIGRYAFHGAENANIYFASTSLPSNLQENWDSGIKGYYVGVTDVTSTDEWDYAVLKDGGISLIKYKGTATTLDLTTLNLGGDIVSIGGYCFYESDITDIVLPDTLTSIQQYAFARSKIQSVTIPANVEFIGKYAFYHTPLAGVSFAENGSLKSIEQYAFARTEALQNIALPASLETMGSNVFYRSGITAVSFAENGALTEISESAFQNTKLVSVVLPESVTLVNHNAFRDCAYLESLTFGAGENLQLMSNVFYNTGLKTVHIPANLIYIGEYAFVGLEQLTSFAVDENNPYYSAIDGLLYNKDGSKLIAVPAGRTGSLVLPEGLEIIGFGAFENTALTEISFNENSNILTFGYRAFYGAKNLKTFNVPASVVSIDYYAFAMCEELETVTFAEGTKLTGVYEGAFYGCRNLKNILLPDSIVEISDFAFYGCSSLTRIPVSSTSGLKGIYKYAFAYTGIKELIVPETVIDIGAYAFRGAKLTKVTVPDTNAKQLIIGIGAFQECNDMAEITLPFIGASFEDMDITWFGYIFGAGGYQANATYVPASLKTVTISEGITFVGRYAFYYLSNLQFIELPKSISALYYLSFSGTNARYSLHEINYVEPVGMDEYGNKFAYVGTDYLGQGIVGEVTFGRGIEMVDFTGCNYLTRITLNQDVKTVFISNCEILSSIILPESVELISIYGCPSLESLYVPQNVNYVICRDCANLSQISFAQDINLEAIEEDAFSGCSSLMNIEIPNSVTSIGKRAFFGCSSLTSVIIPDGVTSIGDYAFASCKTLMNIEVSQSVTIIGDDAFYGCEKLYTITNNSDLKFELGSMNNGCIACYAKVIIDKIGNKTYIEGITELEYIDTADGFRFMKKNGTYQLLVYLGKADTIMLPKDINGNIYEIYQMRGCRNVIIPDGFTVINDNAFSYCSSLTSIVIPDSVRSIGDYAFSGCSSLTNIVIPDSVTSIGNFAFQNCDSLTSIEIPNSLDNIGEYAFSSCSSLSSIVIPESVAIIGYWAFSYCSSLTSIEIPNKVTSIAWGAFSGCSSLTNIKLLESVTSIDQEAFSYCSSLTSIEIPNRVTSIGSFAFRNCNSLTSIVIPNSVTSIGDSAFSGCPLKIISIAEDNLEFIEIDRIIYNKDLTKIIMVSDAVTSVTVPASIKDISSIFSGKTNLKTVTFETGSQLASIGSFTFDGCSSLTNVEIPNGVTSIGDFAFSGCSSLTKIVIPNSVTSIGSGVFCACSSLTSIQIPQGVTSIGEHAFESCSSLTNIIIPNGVTSIEDSTFNVCKNLASIVIPNSVTRIGNQAFGYCSSLTNIVIPDSVTSIGNFAFQNCDSLTSIEISNSVTSIAWGAFSGCSSLTSIIIPNSVINIGDNAFSSCSSLTNVVLPDRVNNIGASTFHGCSSLTSIKIPNSVTSIGYQAFAGCINLERVEISNGVTSIGEYAFFGCGSLTSIIIPNSVIDIGNGAFLECINLYEVINNSDLALIIGSESNGYIVYYAKIIINKDGNKVYFDETSGFEYIDTADEFRFINENGEYKLIAYFGNEDMITLPEHINGKSYEIYYMRGAKNIIIPSSISIISSYAFYECKGLISVVISDGITNIGENAFSDCSSLTSVEIPESVTSIGYFAFYNCSSLTSIEIPNKVTSIGGSAFSGCSSLTSIEIPNSVTSIGGSAFSGCSSLTSIEIPNSVTNIGSSAFGGTAYYNNPSNWTDGCLYIGNALIRVEPATKYFKPREDTTCIADGAFAECYSLIQVEFGGDHSGYLFSLTNLETLILTEMPTEHWIYEYFGWNNIPITFKNIVIRNGVELNRNYAFSNITGVNIYVEAEKEDAQRWDEVYLDWNNGNKVHYGGEWISADFYGTDGSMIDSGIYLTSQVVRQPYYVLPGNEQYSYIIGWDLDGDGFADSVPATSNKNIVAHAVATQVLNQYTVKYYDFDGETVLYAYVLNYGESVPMPENTPEKRGYTFLGWDGYIEGMTATENISIYSRWKHDGGGHTYGELLTKQATCTERGYTYHECSICGDIVIGEYFEATGHVYDEWVIEKEANCTEDGLRYSECANCGDKEYEVIEKTGHNYIGVVTKEATCTRHGEITYTCGHCGDTHKEQVETLPHNYVKKTVSKSWLRWLIERLLNMFFGYEGNNAYYFECKDCRHVQTTEEAMLLTASVQSVCDHVLGEEQLVLAATCEEQGIYGRYCTKCNELIEAMTVDATGHDYCVIETVTPTCDEKGYILHTCATCGDYFATDFTAATGHTPGGWIVDSEADCTHVGSKHKECSVCGEILEIAAIPATGHTEVVDAAVAATCTSTGLTEGKHCSVCGEVIVKQEVVEKLAHTPSEWIVDSEATCTAAGIKHKECMVCGEILETQEIAKLTHTEVWVTDVEATCTAKGSKHKECSVCKELLEIAEIPATGHREVIDAAVEATCTSTGLTEGKHCSVCGEVIVVQEVVEKLAHTEVWVTDIEATCTANGSKHKECSTCGEILEITEIPATGHTEVIDAAVGATCTGTGLTEGRHCSVCGEVIVKQEVVEKLAHTPSEWIIDSEATCTAAGIKHKECTVCGEVLETQEIAKLAHTEVWVTDAEATCTANGSKHKACSTCGEILEIAAIPATGHNYVKEVTMPTCTEQGYTTHTCSICEDSFKDTYVEAKGHHFGEWETVKEATETETGEIQRSCQDCDVSERQEIPANIKKQPTVMIGILSAVGGVLMGSGVLAIVWFVKRRKV